MAGFLTYVLSNPGLAMFALLMVIFAITVTESFVNLGDTAWRWKP